MVFSSVHTLSDERVEAKRRIQIKVMWRAAWRRYSTAATPSFRIVEVGARDGLQNEKNLVSTEDKLELIRRLVASGLRVVEATSFVSAKWVPQMGDHAAVVAGLPQADGISFPVLVPNLAGLDNALATGRVREIAVFGSASDSKNVNCSSKESLVKLRAVTERALSEGLRVRGYVSCVIGCPYEGSIRPRNVARVTAELLDAGCYEGDCGGKKAIKYAVSLGDTIGVGSPGSIATLLDELLSAIPADRLALHAHDTYGQALANVLIAIEKGLTVADASVAGLGGCPYAKGATGNLATEDLVYMTNGLGLKTGVDLDALVSAGDWICEKMARKNNSRVANAILAKRRSSAKTA